MDPYIEARGRWRDFHRLIEKIYESVAAALPRRYRIWTEERAGMVRICVRDNGIGIKPEHIKKLFQPFVRLVNGAEYPGTGIGLAIVRKGTERMGGRVGLESEPDHGSCFWMELPAATQKTV